jgi:GTPase SAR1 family protein
LYISRIILKNIRGFEKLDFSLSRGSGEFAGWTVFAGGNGSGKTTLLKAIALALAGRDDARTLEPSLSGWIREPHHEGEIELEIVPVEGDDKFKSGGRITGDPFPACLRIENGSREPQLLAPVPRAMAGRRTYRTPDRSIWSYEAGGWFSCGYGPFRRVFGASSDAMRKMVAPTSERYVTMFEEAASLAEVDSWLKTLSHKKLENRAAESRQLEIVREILGDGLLPDGAVVDRVDSDGLWLKDQKGVQLAWRGMSEGYRAALALLADIVRHLIKTFGCEGLVERNTEGKLQVLRSGVVLIDEIDLHLHPEWQRQIGFWLTSRFPKIQFLVSTHSPIICQAADENGIFILPGLGSDEVPRAVTQDEYWAIIVSRPDTILRTAVFGLTDTRSPRAVKMRSRHAELSAKKRAGAKLTQKEREELGQARMFADTGEEA